MSEGLSSDQQAAPVAGYSQTLPIRSGKKHKPPKPPPRKSSIPLALEADQSKSIEQLFSTLPEAKDENYFEDSSQDSPSYTSSENSAYTEVFRGSPDTENLPRRGHIRRESLTPTGEMARRVPSFSPTPKPRVPRSSMSRSKSYDQLAVEGTEGKTATNSVYSIPRKPVQVVPPVKPTDSPPSSRNCPTPQTSFTLESLSTSLAKHLPLRIEIIEGYMSNYVQHITFSTSDYFNVHFLKQQEVLRVKDGSGHTYSVPLYSTIRIGLVQHCTTASASGEKPGKSTLLKTTKVSDVMALKDLPKIMAATKAVKSSYGEKSSVDEKEVLLVLRVARVPNKKKKVLEVYSMDKSMNKILYPDCSGHFSLSPSLTALPMSAFFKRIPEKFPFKAHLFFRTDDLTSSSSHSYETSSTIPPPSLTQGEVTVLKRVTETAVLASPYFEDCPLDLTNSANLVHIPLDRHLSKIEVSVVEFADPMEHNKLYSDTCVALEKINLKKVKYYHDADSEAVHNTQTFLYTKCISKGNTGIKMDLPPWNKEPLNSRMASEHETYESIPEAFGSPDHSSSTAQAKQRNRHSGPMDHSVSLSSSLSSSLSLKSQTSDAFDDVFADHSTRPPLPTPSSERTRPLRHTPSMERTYPPGYAPSVERTRPPCPSPTAERPPSKKSLRSTVSQSDVPNTMPSISTRSPCPIPPSQGQPTGVQAAGGLTSKPLLHSQSTPTSMAGQREHYQTPRQALLSSINTFDKNNLTNSLQTYSTPSSLIAGRVPPRDLRRTPGQGEDSSLKNLYHHEEKLVGHEGGRKDVAPANTSYYQTPPSRSRPHPQVTPTTGSEQRPGKQDHTLPKPLEDDADLYEEMCAVSSRKNMAPRPVGISKGIFPVQAPAQKQHVDTARATAEESSGTNEASTQKRRQSDGYEIFDPVVSMKMFKELKSEVATLSQQLQELSHRLAHTEKELQAKKSQKLEGSDNNKEYLKSLSCEQMIQVLEGMGLAQYTEVVKQEVLDGKIFLDLDEATLSQEMGVASRIHRIKMLKLIGGDYDARDFIMGQTSV